MEGEEDLTLGAESSLTAEALSLTIDFVAVTLSDPSETLATIESDPTVDPVNAFYLRNDLSACAYFPPEVAATQSQSFEVKVGDTFVYTDESIFTLCGDEAVTIYKEKKEFTFKGGESDDRRRLDDDDERIQ